MTLALHRQIPREPCIVGVVLLLWRSGLNTHEIAVALGGKSAGRLSQFENAVCTILAQERDRRHAARQPERACA